MQVIVDARELKHLGQKISAAGKNMPKRKEKALGWLGEQFVGLVQDQLEATRWTSDLYNAVQVLEQTENKVVIGPDPVAAPHTKFVLEGGTPHAAPFIKILDWTETKLGGDVALAKKVWWGIYHHGTSQWAAQLYGTGGENPFAERTLATPEARKTLEDATLRLGRDIVAEIVE